MQVGQRRAAVSICEDVWNDPDVWTTRRYGGDPVAALRDLATPVMVNMSASPYAQGKLAQRERLLAHLARKYGVWALYANQVGANDDLVFDGRSMALVECDPPQRHVSILYDSRRFEGLPLLAGLARQPSARPTQ